MAKQRFPLDIDLMQNELQNALFHNLSNPPSNPKIGQYYYDTDDSLPYFWNGLTWEEFGTSGVESVTSTDNHIVVDNTDPANPSLSFQLIDNENLLTDDELAVVQATSGTNTGDQVADGITITGAGSVEDPFVAVNGVVHEYTHAELLPLSKHDGLKIGDLYLLTDYETTYTQPVTNLSMSSGVIEPLLLKASSVNTFEIICSSALYPRDIISYDINDSSEGFTKGKIFRRNDTINSIDAGTDWRHVKYFRAELDVTTAWVQGNNYTVGDIVTTGYDIYICTLTHTNSGDVNTNFYHYPFGNGDFASLYSTGQPIYIKGNEYIIPVSANFEDRLKFGSNCKFHNWDGIFLDNIIIGDENNYWVIGINNNNFTISSMNEYWKVNNNNNNLIIGSDNFSLSIENGNANFTVGDGNGDFIIGDVNGYFAIGDSNYFFKIDSYNTNLLVGNEFLNYEIKNSTSYTSPPNISGDYLKTIYKAGTKKLLEYTDEFGDINIIEL